MIGELYNFPILYFYALRFIFSFTLSHATLFCHIIIAHIDSGGITLINQANIGEWLREVQERPESAPLIIREIANRLIELDRLNEKLRAENLELSSGFKVHQYKSRIAELEYQLEIMSRQFDPRVNLELDTPNLLLYNQRGQVIRLKIDRNKLASGLKLAGFTEPLSVEPGKLRLLAVSPKEELLFMFDSGRTASMPVTDLPTSSGTELSWHTAYQADLRSDQELIVIIPIGKMAAFDQCIQLSRRGYARKIARNYFQKYIAGGNIGKGIISSNETDTPLNLTLCNGPDLLVLVSRQGYITGLPAQSFPIALERALKLDPDDTLATSFVLQPDQSLVAVSGEGRAMRYEASWLKPAANLGGRSQALSSKQKTAQGIQIAGAAAAGDDDWGFGLRQDGTLVAIKIGDIPVSKVTKIEHPLKNIYPFDLVAFTCLAQ
jgi:DNA gyrase/topoisomerase IV subunit A